MPFIAKESPFIVPSITIGGAERGGNIFTSTIITNSGAMTIGDMVAVTTQAAGNGVVVRRYNAAGDKILGVCVGFGRASGAAVAFDAGTRTVTVGADNETVAMIFAYVDITPFKTWSGPFQSGQTIHTTAIFGAGTFVDPGTGANAGAINETGATRTQSTERGLAALGPDKDDTSRGLVMIVEGLFRGANAAS